MLDFWGQEIKRFYQLETLANATEWLLRTSDRFILPSIQEILGPSPVKALSFELFQEGKFQLIFRLRASNAKRKQGSFAFVVAKKHDDISVIAQREHQNLRLLHERAPSSVVQPYRGGTIFLPDRHKRADHGREVYAYLTHWLEGYYELGVTRELQFFVNVAKPHTFSIAQTEALKASMVEIIARTYKPAKRNGMDMPQIASGDFVVNGSGRGVPRLKLIACRHMLEHVTPAKLIDRILGAAWDWGSREFRIAPEDPTLLFEALSRARGEEEARAWMAQYCAAVAAGRLREQEGFPLEELRSFGTVAV